MDYAEIVHLVNTDPVVQTLMELPIAMHLGYNGLDGHPRTVPVTHQWDGRAFIFATPTNTYKVRAIAQHPEVAFTLDVGPGRMAAEARIKVSAVLGLPAVDYGPLSVVGAQGPLSRSGRESPRSWKNGHAWNASTRTSGS
jgi:Pyridoxamine 5'-phosphate oxidase